MPSEKKSHEDKQKSPTESQGAAAKKPRYLSDELGLLRDEVISTSGALPSWAPPNVQTELAAAAKLIANAESLLAHAESYRHDRAVVYTANFIKVICDADGKIRLCCELHEGTAIEVSLMPAAEMELRIAVSDSLQGGEL